MLYIIRVCDYLTVIQMVGWNVISADSWIPLDHSQVQTAWASLIHAVSYIVNSPGGNAENWKCTRGWFIIVINADLMNILKAYSNEILEKNASEMPEIGINFP